VDIQEIIFFYVCIFFFLENEKNIEIYTGYFDTTYTRKFISCATRHILPDDYWAPNEPDNFAGIEYCTSVKLCASCNQFGFYDRPCTNTYPMLCEKQVPPTKVTYQRN
jgi:hypothetical protein